MATPNTVADFIELVEKSELLEKSRITAAFGRNGAQSSQTPTTPKECASALVREGCLTSFQAKLLLAGKWKNFFLGGKYKVLDHLGSGGMGAVFLCEHRYMRRRVALKILPAEKNHSPGGSALQRFIREAQAIARLDHPNIVRAHDIDSDSGAHFLVMEFVDGVSLQNFVQTKGPLGTMRAVNYACQAAAGLHHAFEAGLVHRDVKPSNLLLERTGIIKILDLGLARFAQSTEHLTKVHDSKTVLGTADYLAPEQARDSNVDVRADIYSLGALFYFLLAGKPPFDGGNVAQKLIAHQTQTPARVDSIINEIPAAVADVVARMLAKNRDDRPATPNAVIDLLQPWLRDVPPPSPEEMPESRYTHHRNLDTLSKLSTVASMSMAMRSRILQSASASA